MKRPYISIIPTKPVKNIQVQPIPKKHYPLVFKGTSYQGRLLDEAAYNIIFSRRRGGRVMITPEKFVAVSRSIAGRPSPDEGFCFTRNFHPLARAFGCRGFMLGQGDVGSIGHAWSLLLYLHKRGAIIWNPLAGPEKISLSSKWWVAGYDGSRLFFHYTSLSDISKCNTQERVDMWGALNATLPLKESQSDIIYLPALQKRGLDCGYLSAYCMLFYDIRDPRLRGGLNFNNLVKYFK